MAEDRGRRGKSRIHQKNAGAAGSPPSRSTLRQPASPCSTLQHPASPCVTLRHPAPPPPLRQQILSPKVVLPLEKQSTYRILPPPTTNSPR